MLISLSTSELTALRAAAFHLDMLGHLESLESDRGAELQAVAQLIRDVLRRAAPPRQVPMPL